jgi:hypothetical protein
MYCVAPPPKPPSYIPLSWPPGKPLISPPGCERTAVSAHSRSQCIHRWTETCHDAQRAPGATIAREETYPGSVSAHHIRPHANAYQKAKPVPTLLLPMCRCAGFHPQSRPSPHHCPYAVTPATLPTHLQLLADALAVHRPHEGLWDVAQEIPVIPTDVIARQKYSIAGTLI